MTSRQESRLSMYLAVNDYLSNNSLSTKSLPNYSVFFKSFQESLEKLRGFSEKQLFIKNGNRVNKQELRDQLVKLVADTTRKIQAYAKFTNDHVLLEETKLSESALKRFPDTQLIDKCRGIYNRVQIHLKSLTPYGINASNQSELLKAINEYEISLPKPRLSISEKKQITEQLKESFKLTDSCLEDIDYLIEIVRNSQEEFYSGYISARRLIETGVGSVRVKGKVTDSQSGLPIPGVKISFISDGIELKNSLTSSNLSIQKRTAKQGGFYVKSIPSGNYKVLISKNGYLSQTVSIPVSDGEMSKIEVQLSRN